MFALTRHGGAFEERLSLKQAILQDWYTAATLGLHVRACEISQA